MTRTRSRARARARRAIAVALASVIVGACGASSDPVHGSGDVKLTLQVLVMDGVLRAPGDECSGARPFLYIHADAAYRVEDDATGDPVLTGALPAGTAIEAMDEDLNAPRVPSFCLLSWRVALPDRDRYRLVLEEGEGRRFSAADADSENRVTVIVP